MQQQQQHHTEPGSNLNRLNAPNPSGSDPESLLSVM
jgi:hypothetical protein